MEKLVRFSAALKAIASLAFTGQVMFVTVISMFMGKDVIPVGYIWQMVALSLIFSLLHLHAFSEHETKKLGKSARLAILGVPMLLALSAFAYFFNWFPIDDVINWLMFIGLYVGIFLIASFAFHIAFRLGGIKYNELLASYKSKQEN